MAESKPEKTPRYRVLKGINYPPDGRRAEPGDIVADLPDYGIRGLLQIDAIELVEEEDEAKK